MTTPIKWGNEFLVNTTTLLGQSAPTIASLADGRFVAAFADFSQSGDDSSGDAVRAQIFNADGTKSGSEFLVNTTTNAFQTSPVIAGLSDGRFVVAFSDDSQSGGDTSGLAIRAQIFNADGTKSGTEFLVNTTVSNAQLDPQITSLADGKFVVTYRDVSQSGGDTSSSAVRAQVFNADGTKSGTEFLVNTTTVNDQYQPGIAALSDGRFVIVFDDESQSGGDTTDTAVRAQIFNADGTKSGTEFLVNTTTLSYQSGAAVAGLENGRFVVTYVDGSQSGDDTSGSAIRGQVFNSDGTKSGSEFLVNTIVIGPQYDPEIAVLNDGRFVVVYTGQSLDDFSSTAVMAQVFNVDGTKSGAEFMVNTTTTDGQSGAVVTVLADGRFVVSFSDLSLSSDDSSFSAVRGQIFDPRIAGIDIGGTADNDELVGSDFADVIEGNAGNDAIYGGLSNDRIEGGSGNDKLFGEEGKDKLFGGTGGDKLYGGDKNDLLKGGAGKDKLFGEGGKDKIYGGKGNDKLTGNDGKDVFVFKKNEGKDTITDFENGKDKIDLKAFNFNNKAQALAKFFEIGSASNDKLGFKYKGTEIVVKGIDMGQLNGADIII